LASQAPIQDVPSYEASNTSSRQKGDFVSLDGPHLEATLPISARGTSRFVSTELSRAIGHSLEFIAMPDAAEELQAGLPQAIRYAVRNFQSFAGSMVLVSEQEARLLTVITLWKGEDHSLQCEEYSRRLRNVLAPYVDRWLRVQRFGACVTLPQQCPETQEKRSEVRGVRFGRA